MKPREKLLAILAVAAILLSQGMPIYSHFFVDPVNERRSDLTKLEGEVQDRELTDRSIRRARTNLTKWRSASLPPEWRNAQRLYLEWLTDLAKMAGFSDLKVTPTPSLREGKVYTPVRVSIEAKVGYDQLCRFLDRFQKADLLHRISEMNVKKAEGGGDSKLAVTLVAESLALASAEKRDFVLPSTTLKDELSKDGTTVTVTSAELFPTKNEFLARSGNEILRVKSVDGANWVVERGVESTSADARASGAAIELLHVFSKAKANAATSISVDEIAAHNLFTKPSTAGPQDPFESDYAKNTYLRALYLGDKAEGWLYEPSNERKILHEGSKFQIADLEATVVELHNNYIIVEAGNEKRKLRLGESLQSMGKGYKGNGGAGRPEAGRGPGGPGDSNSEKGRGRRGGGRGRGRGFPGMDDPAKREKMMERMRQFREARERGEDVDFRDFMGDGNSPSEGNGAGNESTAQPVESEAGDGESKDSEK